MQKTTFILIGILFLMTSCIKDIDLDQVENLKLKPALITPLINIELNSNDFVNGTEEVNNFYKKTTFEFLNNNLGKNNVKKIQFKLLASNEIKRNFIIKKIFFLDNKGSEIYTNFKDIDIRAEDKTFKEEVLISINNNSNFRNIKFVEIDIEMESKTDGSILDTNDQSKLEINLSAILYSKI